MLPKVEIRPVMPSELKQLRQIRLRALAESPGAYGSRYEEEAALPPTDWQPWVTEGSTFVAEDGDQWVGLAAALVDHRDPDGYFVLSMWVDPQRRGQGVGRKLLDAVVTFAAVQGAARVRLGVVEGNGSAINLYESSGFRRTGDREPLRSDPSRTVAYLRLELGTEAAAGGAVPP